MIDFDSELRITGPHGAFLAARRTEFVYAKQRSRSMPVYYVATIARYVLVEAANEDEARRIAEPKLRELYADVRCEISADISIRIHTVRAATAEEIELQRWHAEAIAAERKSS